jgi:peptide/nickel transport system permease protein
MAAIQSESPLRARRSPLWGRLGGGAAFVGLMIVAASIGPIVSPYLYDQMDVLSRLKPPSQLHWAGTDEFGRDVLTRALVGTRTSLFVGFGATLVSLVLGVALGLLAGYKRGWVDETVMRVLDVAMAFPPLILVLLIAALTEPSFFKLVVIVGFLFAPGIARVTRSVTLDLAMREFVTAARARGESSLYILFRELLPNALPVIIVEGSLNVTFAMLLAAVLSFLGFGIQPPAADWGLMISQARRFMPMAPWIALVPGVFMCSTVIAINVLGDGLREHLDPRMRTLS